MNEKWKPFDMQAVNPRSQREMMSDVARVLTRPKSKAALATLDRLQGRAAGSPSGESGGDSSTDRGRVA